MKIKHFKTVFFLVSVLLILSAALSLIFSAIISSSDISSTVKTVLDFFNFLLPSTGILFMTVFIYLRGKRIRSSK